MQILRRSNQNMTSEQAANNAEQIIQAMHMFGFQMGPLESFGPHEGAIARDVFDNFDEMLKLTEERDQWHELR